jgi:hypothetical protein
MRAGCCSSEAARQCERASAFLYAFDLLAVDGVDVRREQLDERRARLRQFLARPEGIRFSEGTMVMLRSCSPTPASSGSTASSASGAMRPTDLGGRKPG